MNAAEAFDDMSDLSSIDPDFLDLNEEDLLPPTPSPFALYQSPPEAHQASFNEDHPHSSRQPRHFATPDKSTIDNEIYSDGFCTMQLPFSLEPQGEFDVTEVSKAPIALASSAAVSRDFSTVKTKKPKSQRWKRVSYGQHKWTLEQKQDLVKLVKQLKPAYSQSHRVEYWTEITKQINQKYGLELSKSAISSMNMSIERTGFRTSKKVRSGTQAKVSDLKGNRPTEEPGPVILIENPIVKRGRPGRPKKLMPEVIPPSPSTAPTKANSQRESAVEEFCQCLERYLETASRLVASSS